MATEIVWGVYIVFALIIFVAYVYDEGFELAVFIPALLIPLIPAVLLTAVFMFIAIFSDRDYSEPELVKTTNISALKDNSKMSGAFFLATGGVGEDQYYYYMEDTSKGKKMDKLNVDADVYLNEDNSEKPRVETYKKEAYYKSKFSNFMFKDSEFYAPSDRKEYIIYIPEDSVTTEFNVDMED